MEATVAARSIRAGRHLLGGLRLGRHRFKAETYEQKRWLAQRRPRYAEPACTSLPSPHLPLAFGRLILAAWSPPCAAAALLAGSFFAAGANGLLAAAGAAAAAAAGSGVGANGLVAAGAAAAAKGLLVEATCWTGEKKRGGQDCMLGLVVTSPAPSNPKPTSLAALAAISSASFSRFSRALRSAYCATKRETMHSSDDGSESATY